MLGPTAEIRDTTIGFHEEVLVEEKRAAKKTDQLPKNREQSVGGRRCGTACDTNQLVCTLVL